MMVGVELQACPHDAKVGKALYVAGFLAHFLDAGEGETREEHDDEHGEEGFDEGETIRWDRFYNSDRVNRSNVF